MTQKIEIRERVAYATPSRPKFLGTAGFDSLITLNLNFESAHVDQADGYRNGEGDHCHGRTVPELKGGEGLIVNVNANNLGSIARAPAGECVDETENRDGRNGRNQ